MNMKTTLRAGILAIAICSAALSAAQTNGPQSLSVRIGAIFPSNRAARDVGKTWLGFGVDYKLKEFKVDGPQGTLSYISVSADYYKKDELSAVPFAVNYNVRQGQAVFSAGIGFDTTKVNHKDSTGFSGQLGYTYEFRNGKSANNPFFLQAKYFFASKSVLNALGVFAGYRF